MVRSENLPVFRELFVVSSIQDDLFISAISRTASEAVSKDGAREVRLTFEELRL
jgi:hypothetical protein